MGHLQFVLEVRENSQPAQENGGVVLPGVVDRQPVKPLDF